MIHDDEKLFFCENKTRSFGKNDIFDYRPQRKGNYLVFTQIKRCKKIYEYNIRNVYILYR